MRNSCGDGNGPWLWWWIHKLTHEIGLYRTKHIQAHKWVQVKLEKSEQDQCFVWIYFGYDILLVL